MKIRIADTAKYESHYNKHTHIVYETIMWLKPLLEKTFDVADDLEILIRPIRQKKGTTTGGLSCGQLSIEVECRINDVFRIADIIAHEMTHAEQKKQGRLGWQYQHDLQKSTHVWEGASIDQARTHDEYLNLPWEVEARRRASEFTREHMFLLNDVEREVRATLPMSLRINRRK